MRYLVPAVLLIVAAIHALPVVGVLGAGKLVALYGVPVQDPNLEILLRHRAVLFGLLAAFLACAAFMPALHRMALVAGWVSVASYLALALSVGGFNSALSTVVHADLLALALLLAGGLVHLLQPGARPHPP